MPQSSDDVMSSSSAPTASKVAAHSPMVTHLVHVVATVMNRSQHCAPHSSSFTSAALARRYVLNEARRTAERRSIERRLHF